MMSNTPGDEKASDNESDQSQSDEHLTPEEVAAAAIDAAQAKAKEASDANSDDNAAEDDAKNNGTEEGAEANSGGNKAGEDSDAEADASADSKASKATDDSAKDAGDGASDDKGAESEADPLGFDDARMPETENDGVDLSANGAAAEGAEEDAEPDLETQLAAANAKVDEHWARILRMQADLENERKRTQKQVASAHKFAIEKFAEELLPIKDSLEMGLDAAKADDADLTKIVEGSELTLKLLSQAFEKNQIVEVNPVDEKFDPNVHQAMSMQEAEGKEPNTVIGVMQKGYTLNDRLIRPALVTVSKP